MRKTLLLAAFLGWLGCGNTGGDAPDGGSAGADVRGCDDAILRPNPADPKEPGPWAVGARTVRIGRLTVEVWYPAADGSEVGQDTVRYDIRDELPASERGKIPDADNPWQDCDCYRDLPLDETHGPYPVVVFVHGTAAFRHQSLPIVTHWASRGFVVVAADHPGLMLGDFLALACSQPQSGSQDLSADLDDELAALAAPTGDLAFLADHLDTARVAIAGHSAGASAAAAASGKPGVQVVLSLAGAQAAGGPSLFMGAATDQVVQWNQVKAAYDGSPAPKRLVEIANAGHLVFSDLCQIENDAGDDLVTIAQAHDVCGAQFASFLFDCDPAYVDGPTGWDIVDYATSAVLESTLQCNAQSPDLAGIADAVPGVMDYQQSL